MLRWKKKQELHQMVGPSERTPLKLKIAADILYVIDGDFRQTVDNLCDSAPIGPVLCRIQFCSLSEVASSVSFQRSHQNDIWTGSLSLLLTFNGSEL